MALFYSFWMDLLLTSAILIVTLYYFLNKNNDYWKKKGIYGPKPHFFFGNFQGTLLGKISLLEEFAELYKATKNEPYVGIFMLRRPTLLINHPDMIKNILTKDFEHFTDHPFQFNIKNDPIMDNLFNATGSRWKNMRIKMTPTFTSNKMREMFLTVAECGKEMVTYLNMHGDDCVVDIKDLVAKLSTDVIGSCAFGIECNSFKYPDAEFRKMGRKLFTPTFLKNFLILFNCFMPDLISRIGMSVLGNDVNDFFYNVVKDGIEYRRRNGIVRRDFLQILMQMLAEDGADDGNQLTLRGLSAQAFIFFVGGFETSSSVVGFALYEMALNPEIQNRLVDEIGDSLKRNKGEFNYDSIKEMTYLAQVVNDKGTPVMIPILGVQKDLNIYPDPEKFDPERFSNENKASRHQFAFLPFGEGPRFCIGNRFGLMQTKLGIVTLLSKFEVSICEKTTIPIKFNPKAFVLQSKDGIWLRLKKRIN